MCLGLRESSTKQHIVLNSFGPPRLPTQKTKQEHATAFDSHNNRAIWDFFQKSAIKKSTFSFLSSEVFSSEIMNILILCCEASLKNGFHSDPLTANKILTLTLYD